MQRDVAVEGCGDAVDALMQGVDEGEQLLPARRLRPQAREARRDITHRRMVAPEAEMEHGQAAPQPFVARRPDRGRRRRQHRPHEVQPLGVVDVEHAGDRPAEHDIVIAGRPPVRRATVDGVQEVGVNTIRPGHRLAGKVRPERKSPGQRSMRHGGMGAPRQIIVVIFRVHGRCQAYLP